MKDDETRKGRFSHLGDFKKNSDGEYEYVGKTYELDCEVKPFKVKIAVLAAMLVASVIACGAIPAKGMTDTFYVMLPLLSEILAAAFLAYKIVAFIFAAYPVRAYAMQKTVKPIPIISCVAAATSLSRLVAYAIYNILNSANFELLYFTWLMLLNVTVVITAVYIAIAFKKNRWSLKESSSETNSDNE